MITPRQIRAARALLGWTQERLADAALVALTALKRLEAGDASVRASTREAVRRALESAGIEWIAMGRRIGVALEADRGGQHKELGEGDDQTESQRAGIRRGTRRRDADGL